MKQRRILGLLPPRTQEKMKSHEDPPQVKFFAASRPLSLSLSFLSINFLPLVAAWDNYLVERTASFVAADLSSAAEDPVAATVAEATSDSKRG